MRNVQLFLMDAVDHVDNSDRKLEEGVRGAEGLESYSITRLRTVLQSQDADLEKLMNQGCDGMDTDNRKVAQVVCMYMCIYIYIYRYVNIYMCIYMYNV